MTARILNPTRASFAERTRLAVSSHPPGQESTNPPVPKNGQMRWAVGQDAGSFRQKNSREHYGAAVVVDDALWPVIAPTPKPASAPARIPIRLKRSRPEMNLWTQWRPPYAAKRSGSVAAPRMRKTTLLCHESCAVFRGAERMVGLSKSQEQRTRRIPHLAEHGAVASGRPSRLRRTQQSAVANRQESDTLRGAWGLWGCLESFTLTLCFTGPTR